ncbi:hypothetical protein N7489_004599 [Penicillium chrysogenum]|uniref:Pc21g00330 protein n=2 Tax=Penicillium chrysogenum species complex TaxID=254878 RepID=B6HN44_PENRW|nr:uncharacterized protein N7489_004599 [Penicillium chrysogenum]KAJ5244503.1 hypothetical protein N7489_004599 [Penicillium chrysogenum]KAJ5852968.1 hypothetical protein N7534_005511 [Penicillium rubens]CAP94930.1 Pc21g00330 [Penicillium rubens Wisconsin 54-1255]
MSQLSLFSDAYPSSLYEGDTIDGLSFPNDQFHNPDLSGSQQTSDSVSNPGFLTPIPPPSVPPSLERVGPGRSIEFVLYSDMSKDEFVAWWLETEFGRKKRLHWSGNRTAACWQHFDQVANAKTGKPGAKCRQCHKVLDHPANGRYGTTALHRHLAGPTCRKSTRQKTNIKGLLINAAQNAPATPTPFTQEAWEHKLLKLLCLSRLPFRFIEHAEFRDVIAYARLAPTQPQIPSAKTMRSQLRGYVQEQQQSILKQLPPGVKLSLALDCWTSPFGQAFMAVTGYFLDQHWEYREILLGFQPLTGPHTGVNLSEVVLKLLQQHKIADRVLAVTTDNASNNKTMISSIRESLQSLESNNGSTIVRVPCIAHVIQLSLNDLLGKMKATPKNEHAEMNWSEDRVRSLRVRQQKREIIDTLNKVRNLAIYINASPQRRESFCNLQTEEPKLVPIQDVRTRWNSTFLMLRRAKRLQSTFDEFCTQYDQDDFALNQEEWRQIEYLLWITQPFFKFTTLLSKTKDVSIHLIFSIYNKLFAHLEKSKSALKRKKVAWKQLMLSSLEAAEKKLSHYYNQTDDINNNLYAIGTILSPQHKLQFFEGKDWEDPVHDWHAQSASKTQSPMVAISELEMECQQETSQHLLSGQYDELKEYLESGTVRTPTAVFWKDHQRQFPALANLARDVLSIPATGAGVERLFNSARDVCHYRRGSLNPSTIQDLMMFMCTSRFEIEDSQRTLINEYLSHEEVQANQEAKSTDAHQLEPISDYDECESDRADEDEIEPVPDPTRMEPSELLPCQPLVNGPQPKRRQRGLSEKEEGEHEDNSEPGLPDTQNRHSGRVRKRSRLLDGYEVA